MPTKTHLVSGQKQASRTQGWLSSLPHNDITSGIAPGLGQVLECQTSAMPALPEVTSLSGNKDSPPPQQLRASPHLPMIAKPGTPTFPFQGHQMAHWPVPVGFICLEHRSSGSSKKRLPPKTSHFWKQAKLLIWDSIWLVRVGSLIQSLKVLRTHSSL